MLARHTFYYFNVNNAKTKSAIQFLNVDLILRMIKMQQNDKQVR